MSLDGLPPARRQHERFEFGRGGTPEEAAGAVYLMCTPESDYITGELVLASGGFVM